MWKEVIKGLGKVWEEVIKGLGKVWEGAGRFLSIGKKGKVWGELLIFESPPVFLRRKYPQKG